MGTDAIPSPGGFVSWLETDDISHSSEATAIGNARAVVSHRNVGPCPAIQASSHQPSSVVEAEMIFDWLGCEWCNPKQCPAATAEAARRDCIGRFAPAALASPQAPTDRGKARSRQGRAVGTPRQRFSSLAEKGPQCCRRAARVTNVVQ